MVSMRKNSMRKTSVYYRSASKLFTRMEKRKMLRFVAIHKIHAPITTTQSENRQVYIRDYFWSQNSMGKTSVY